MWNNCLREQNPKFLNVNFIFPTMQYTVNEIVNRACEKDHISCITIFGSSTRSSCNPWSDVDLYVECDKSDENVFCMLKGIATKMDTVLDIWDSQFNIPDELLLKSIMEGVVVYERDTVR